MKKNYFLCTILVWMVMLIGATPSWGQTSEYCTYEGVNEHTGRSFNSLTITGGVEDFTISQYVGNGGDIYQNWTDQVLTATAGSALNFSTSWNGEWMHGYLYIDYNKDGEFDASINDDGTPAEDSEIVSYTFYSPTDGASGKNSAGEDVANDSKLDYFPAFTLPADLATGDYRVRFKIDWNELDACGIHTDGKNSLTSNGGIIADFTLHIEGGSVAPDTYTVSVEEVEGCNLTVIVNTDVPSYVNEGQSLEVVPNALIYITTSVETGYVLNSVMANGVAIEPQGGYYFYEITGDVVISADVQQEGGSASNYTVSVEDVLNGTIVAMVWVEDETKEGGGYYSYLDETMSGQYADGSIGFVYINSIAENYHLKEITANGVVLYDPEYEGFYEFTINGADVVISAIFEEDGQAIDELESNNVKVYATDGKIVINTEEAVSVQIYTANGVAFKAPFSAVGYQAIDAPAGMYIVNVNGVAKMVMVK